MIPVAAVPEPATWAMLILGFGLIGAQLRAQRVKLVRRPRAEAAGSEPFCGAA